MTTIVIIIDWVLRALMLVVLVEVILSYFLPPYHPVRQFLDRIVQPMLKPIRRSLPQTGMVDFSPLVLILLFQLLSMVLRGIFL